MFTLSIATAQTFAQSLLAASGMDAHKAEITARLLAETDAMGRRTHGLAMLPLYLRDIKSGAMRVTGTPTVVKDSGATLVWDADYLAGLWLVHHAIETLRPRVAQHGIAAIAICKSHHIGCLAALTRQAAADGLVVLVANSDPSGKRVAPYGGREALLTPNPFAFAYPSGAHPVLIDTCASISTTSMTRQKVARGETFDAPWLLDAHGAPTTDPRVLEHTEPRGSLQLTGGQDHGHKGFGLSLMIEALSQGLSGHGRADAPTRWGGNVYVQLIDPAFFAGDDAFVEQSSFLSNACRANAPIDTAKPVRMPGDAAHASAKTAAASGLTYDAATWQALTDAATGLGVLLPDSR